MHSNLVTIWLWTAVACSAGQDGLPASGASPGTWLERLLLATDATDAAHYEAARSILLELIKDADGPGPERERLPVLWNQMAMVDYGTGRYLDAERWFERALAAARKMNSPSGVTLQVLNGMLLLCIDTGRFDKAEAVAARFESALREATAVDPRALAHYRADLGALYISQRRHLEAGQLLAAAIEEAERQLGPEHLAVTGLLQQYGVNALVQAKWTDAIACFERTLKTTRHLLGPEHPGTARQMNNLAIAYRHAGRVTEAEALARQAAAVFENRLGPDHPYVADALQEQAATLRKLKRAGEARALERRAQLIRRKCDRDNLLGGTVGAGELALRNSHH